MEKVKEVIMAKYGEIALKGLNKHTFEDLLIKNIKRRLSKFGKSAGVEIIKISLIPASIKTEIG